MSLTSPPLTDVPANLRAIADDIEAGRRLGVGGSAVLILDSKSGGFELMSFGETDSSLTAAALSTASTKLALLRLGK